MLGSANFHAGPVLAFMAGNLCYQIEHHLFPDLPHHYLLVLRTILKLALPDRFLRATSDDAHETASEKRFRRPREKTGPDRRWETQFRGDADWTSRSATATTA
jgi:fatty acid desaturase